MHPTGTPNSVLGHTKAVWAKGSAQSQTSNVLANPSEDSIPSTGNTEPPPPRTHQAMRQAVSKVTREDIFLRADCTKSRSRGKTCLLFACVRYSSLRRGRTRYKRQPTNNTQRSTQAINITKIMQIRTARMPAAIRPPPSHRKGFSCRLFKFVVYDSSTLGVMLRRTHPLNARAFGGIDLPFIHPPVPPAKTQKHYPTSGYELLPYSHKTLDGFY